MNKACIGLVVIIMLFSCSAAKKANFTVVPDVRAKVLRGIITSHTLESDTAFSWFTTNQQYGTADANAVNIFRTYKKAFKMVVFGGTWCEDTQNLLPVFYRLVNKSGYPQKNVTLLAVDRKKKTSNNLSEQYHITNVPTFIVTKNGKEVGRVTEYGTIGAIDKELGEIVQRTNP